MVALPLTSEDIEYTPNQYLVANYDYTSNDYFFVRPKRQEYNTIKYAIYRDGKLTMANQTGDNPWDMMIDGKAMLTDEQPYFSGVLEENGVYDLQVICKYHARYTKVAIVNATKIGDFQEMEATTLADMLENGENGKLYRIADALAVVDVPQNFEPFAFLSDGKGNWIKVEFPYELYEIFQKDGFVEAGTLKGVLHDKELNPYLVISAAEFGYPLDDDVEVENVNLAHSFTLKPNQVIDVTGYWNEHDGALRAYAPGNGLQGQSLTLTTDWAGWGITLIDGTRYNVRAAITLKEPWPTTDGAHLNDYDFPFQNYIANALYEPETNIPTGVEDLKMENVKSIRYVNAAGIESDTPFQGVNIVVIEMTDGSKKIVKTVK